MVREFKEVKAWRRHMLGLRLVRGRRVSLTALSAGVRRATADSAAALLSRHVEYGGAGIRLASLFCTPRKGSKFV